ncbi:hypothetical protein D8B22_15460, partial [Verminephrobacter aporrectodeae subsp. tuberculatae]
VAYADPTTDDDANAIQDAAGNDAANFAATEVVNDTPAPADTTAPQLITSGDTTRPRVNGDQLVLSFGNTDNLDADPIYQPESEAFAVLVNGVANAVTNVTVDARAKTVTLTLSTAVSHGQSVTVAYADPTTDDDTNAIQDTAGNDAATFAAMAVDNRTPAPQGQTPSASSAPSTLSTLSAPAGPTDRSTQDSNGIPGSAKDQTPGISSPAGTAPVAGDGNGDGIQDNTQAAVHSTRLVLSNPTGASQPADTTSTPVTLVAGSQDGKLDPDSSGARITRLAQEDAPAELPQGMETPLGLLSFEATLATGRSSQTFSLYLDPALGVNGYWTRDSAGNWVNLSSAPYGGKMANEGGRLRLDFEISDGGPFDADGRANGALTAPGAAAQMPLSLVGQAPDAAGGLWF